MEPFRIHINDAAITDLTDRLSRVRWPSGARLGEGEGQDARGPGLDTMRALTERWADFDWRSVEARLNGYPQFIEDIDGVDVHFFHVRSLHEDAVPLLLTHGWPGSAADFVDVIEPLTAPERHGGRAEDAFHVVIPDLPGFGFSGQPSEGGWTIPQVATAWAELMSRLGYEKYWTQGGDIGAWISQTLLELDPAARAGHVNFLITPPPAEGGALASLDEESLGRLGRLGAFITDGAAYMALQATRPQTLAYGLADSPVGQLAWILEKYRQWGAHPEALTADQVLTQASLFWFTGTGGSSAHFYADNASFLPTSATPPPASPVLTKPFGVAAYLGDPSPPVRALAEPGFARLVHWAEHEGGHFAPLEVPATFVADLRAFRRAVAADASGSEM